MRAFLRRLRARIKYRHFERDLSREIDTHRAIAEEHARASQAADPRSAAAKLLGNTTIAKEEARAVWIGPLIESVWQDLRYAVRGLARAPAFTLAAGSAIVVAVGLNAGVFAVFNAVALRPWPIHRPDRVILVSLTDEARTHGAAPAEYRYLRDRSVSAALVAFQPQSVTFDTNTAVEPARFVSGNYFDVLGFHAQAGRTIVADDDVIGAPRAVVVLGDGVWRRRFGGDVTIIGRSVNINGASFTVVGIAESGARDSSAPPSAFFPMAALPLANPGDESARDLLTNPNHCCVHVAGRLSDGRTAVSAKDELTTAHREFSRTIGRVPSPMLARMGVSIADTRPVSQDDAAQLLPIFELLFSGMALLLLLACANVGNLQLARALSRQREVSIRLALGAGRGRIVRQFLTEGAVLATGAGLVAVVVAWIGPPLVLKQLRGGENAALLDLSPDVSLVLFSLGVSLACSVLFGLVPALRVTRQLSGSARLQKETSGGRLPLRTALLTAQVAISTVLLIGAGLLVRGVVRASTLDPGYRTADIAVAAVQLPRDAYSTKAQQAWYATWLQALEKADVGHVGSTGTVPLSGMNTSTSARLSGQPESTNRRVQLHRVSPGYFDVMGFRFLTGRPLVMEDLGVGVVINETLARMLWNTTDVVGRPLYAGHDGRVVTGVMADAHLTSLGPAEPAFFEIDVESRPEVFLRSVSGIRERVANVTARLEPRATVSMHLLRDDIDAELRDSKVWAGVALGVGLSGLALAAMGAFGVFAYLVNERSREIGVRRAIGARGIDVAALVLGRTGGALGVGLAVGLVAALLAGPVLENSLYGLNPRDPLTIGVVLGVLILASLIATAIPLMRALRVDPAITLRQD